MRLGPFNAPKPQGPHGNCGHAEYVWVSACNTSCCDPKGACAEYRWQREGTAFKNGLQPESDVPGSTLTVDPEGVKDTLMVEEAFPKSDARYPQQQVLMDQTAGKPTLMRIGTTGRCLSAAPPSSTSVFARRLAMQPKVNAASNHSVTEDQWAVLFINWGASAAAVECGQECFEEMGATPGMVFKLRDVWQAKDEGTVSATKGVAPTVPGNGASALYMLTPA